MFFRFISIINLSFLKSVVHFFEIIILLIFTNSKKISCSEQKMSSSLSSSGGSTPPPVPSSEPPLVEPFTEQEISVYKKLCQDLENLVQLTKGIDEEPRKPQISPVVLQEAEEEVEVKPLVKEQSIEEYIYDNCEKAESATKEEEAPLKEEEEEGKDTLDEVFYRDLRLAKLRGDWKESTPNRRRSGTTGTLEHQDNNWEGEIRQRQVNHCKLHQASSSTSSSAYNELSRLTAKCACYITNHLTAQFFLLLVFLTVLLFAIITVP